MLSVCVLTLIYYGSRKIYSLVKVSGMIIKPVIFIIVSLTQTEKVADKDRRSVISTVVSQP